MGLEGQLHHIIIHSKPVMKSPSSSAPIRKKLKRGGERKKKKWIKSPKIFRMIVERIQDSLEGFSHGFFPL